MDHSELHRVAAAAALPFYAEQGDEAALFEHVWRQRLPLLIKGPTGCGKTRFVEHMAARLGRPLITVSCHDDLAAADLVGRHLLGQEPRPLRGPHEVRRRRGGHLLLDPRGDLVPHLRRVAAVVEFLLGGADDVAHAVAQVVVDVGEVCRALDDRRRLVADAPGLGATDTRRGAHDHPLAAEVEHA